MLRIARAFRWSRFAPVVVSPVEDGRFAIVDGQHRTTAALLAGHAEVPCQVIHATPQEQAESFAAINGNVTRVSALALYNASLVSGDRNALAIEKAARRAGVKICPYPKSELNQEPGETLAIGAISACLKLHGENIVVLALRCIVETRNRVKGGILAAIVQANCQAIAALPRSISSDEGRVIAAFDGINLIREMSKAQATERDRGTAIWTILGTRIVRMLDDHFGLMRTKAVPA